MKLFNKTLIIDREHTVSYDEVGRLDLISSRIYGNPLYYRAIAHANGIKMPLISRYCVSNVIDVVKNEIYLNNGTLDDSMVKKLIDEYSYDSLFDYQMIGDNENGMASDIFEGRLLYIPSDQSAVKFMLEYK